VFFNYVNVKQTVAFTPKPWIKS